MLLGPVVAVDALMAAAQGVASCHVAAIDRVVRSLEAGDDGPEQH